ncbi:MAG TPA: HEPN domain-containing protein [Armatimonadota bacterium]|nr:HEPN domain-containing protein [Armatimonadota bacterium]
MTEEQRELLLEAKDSIAAARILLDNGYPSYAAARAYYAMFYTAEAFLEGEGMSFSKHSAVISAFGREFVRSGKVSADYHRYLVEAQGLRHLGDYGPRFSVSREEAIEQIERAEQFLNLAETMMGV